MNWRLRRWLTSKVQQKIISADRRNNRRAKAELARQRDGRRHQIHYFHQLDDPYSHLAAQKLADFALRFDVDVLPHLVSAQTDAPDSERLAAYARLDASRIAPFYGLTFDKNWQPPSVPDQLLAARVLKENYCSYLAEISTALWSGDRAKLEAMPQAEAVAADDLVAAGTALRKKWGHYSGAMFFYEGEWYWGLDRLPHLEERLNHLGARRIFGPTTASAPRSSNELTSIDWFNETRRPKLKIEFFPSLRSPYSYLSMAETLELEKLYPVELIFRPVLPMVMRGMKVPTEKGLYILMDAKREAEAAGIPFGPMLDPVGLPVLRGFSLFPYARDKGKAGAYLESFMRAAWAEGVDVYSKKGLHHVVWRAEINWTEGKQFMDKGDWRAEIEENMRVLFEAGVWGVPSYRLLGDEKHEDFVVWGNDRLWLLKEEIVRRCQAA